MRSYSTVASAITTLASIAPRLGRLIRLLASSSDGEALGAARALARTLKSVNSDFHALAETVENATHAAPAPRASAHDDDHDDINWRAVAAQLLANGKLSPREKEFVEHMTKWRGAPTKRQRDWLLALRDRELQDTF